MSLNQQDIRKIATLARIKIEDSEIPAIAEQLNGIMNWIDQLNTIDLKNIQEEEVSLQSLMHEREDEITEPSQVEAILMNAPVAHHHMFAVPKVVE